MLGRPGSLSSVQLIAVLRTLLGSAQVEELAQPLRGASPAAGRVSTRTEAARKSQLACFSFLIRLADPSRPGSCRGSARRAGRR